MSDAFRHEPPRQVEAWVSRPRLLDRLQRRFELALTLIVAPAGYGKTTVLTQAIRSVEDDDTTVDVWLQCQPADSDAGLFAEAMLRSSGLEPGAVLPEQAARALTDALLRFAPRHVCLVLDDVHLIESDSPSWALLDELVDQLPANAHVLLSGRTTPSLRLATERRTEQVELITTADLRYDDDERYRAIGETAAFGGDGRWPALTLLARNRMASESILKLLDEVVAPLGSATIAALAALSTLRHVGDDVVAVATNGALNARQLLANLPLVHHAEDGSYQLHDLWRQALAGPGRLDGRAAAVLVDIASRTLADGHFVEAAEHFRTAGDDEGLRLAASTMLAYPLTHLAASAVRQMCNICDVLPDDDPIVALLDATIVEQRDERTSSEAFEAVAISARASGNTDVEALALMNAMNMRSIVDPATLPDWLLERALVLAALGESKAQVAVASIRSHRARLAGDVDGAASFLEELSTIASAMAASSQAFGYSDLGWPENVATPVNQDQATVSAARPGNQSIAQAIWLRGEVSPELALQLGAELAASADESQMAHVHVSTNAVLTMVALAAGDVNRAREFSTRAGRWASHTASVPARSLAGIAATALLLVEVDERSAADSLQRVLAAEPIGSWPSRAYLYALPLIYSLDPSSRELLDRCRFGPALDIALRAGQALVELREHDDPAPASALPWHRPWLLRAHVLPPQLAELAAAAAAEGQGDVGLVLQELPELRGHLLGASRLTHAPTAAWASDRIAQLPERPDFDLHIDVLGPMVLARGQTVVTEPHWLKRERVRELLAALLVSGYTSRQQLAELIWPDLDPSDAASNLRVNLNHLQKVVQPSRGEGRPWFVQMTADRLEIASSGVVLDLHRFEAAAGEARHLDETGSGSLAIERLRLAAGLHRGELFADLPNATWLEPDRARIRALAGVVFSRLGELVLARGDPEEAAAFATRTLRLEPMHERAGRLLARSLAAQDDRAGAARMLRRLLEQLADEGLVPERATTDLQATLGVTPVGVPGSG